MNDQPRPCSYCWGGAKKVVQPSPLLGRGGTMPATCPVCQGSLVDRAPRTTSASTKEDT